MTIEQIISQQIQDHDVILYMKGTPTFPQCGFSSRVVSVLKYLEVEFHTINVLDDDEIREGIKLFSTWPTVPQLYIKGEFVGGCDIVTEMFQNGELKQMFVEQGLLVN